MNTTTYYPDSACVVALETDADQIKALLELDAPYPPRLLGERRAAFAEKVQKMIAEEETRAMLEKQFAEVCAALDEECNPELFAEAVELDLALQDDASNDMMEAQSNDAGYGSAGPM